MKKFLLASASILLLAAAPAMAADAIIDEPVAPELPVGFSWTGAYIGVQAGYTWGDADTQALSGAGALLATGSPDYDGFLGGVYVGYNYQMSNNIVLGVDADFAWSGADGSAILRNPAGVAIPPNRHSVDLDWSGAVRARLGYAVDRFLPYIAGGVAFGKADFAFDHVGASGRADDTLTGWTIGGGVEYAATDNLIVRAEYRYTDLGDGRANSFAAPFALETQTWDLKSHDLRIGVAYKF